MQAGCCIDGSHMSNTDFMIAVIEFAASKGFDLDTEQLEHDKFDLVADDLDEDYKLDILDALDWTMQEAMDYLNDEVAPEGSHFWIHESSLYLEEADA